MAAGKPTHRAFTRGEMLASFLILAGVSAFFYLTLWTIDFGLMWGQTPLELFVQPGAVDTLTNFGEITVGVLGISLTVVTIIVELASNRYTPRITELFLRDPVNASVLSFFVVSAVFIVWVDMSLYGARYPQYMAGAAVLLMSATLLALLPYFAYVFDFLLPNRVVQRIERKSAEAIQRMARVGTKAVRGARLEVKNAIEQLGDVALNSVDKKDKAIALASLAALAELAEVELLAKDRLPTEWFDTRALTAEDQDFVALHPKMVRALAERRTWMLMKILRQFQSVFGEAVNQIRDVNHVIAIHTRRLATVAVDLGDQHAVDQCMAFLNTYLRNAINCRDVRTAYNLYNEYRALGEHFLEGGHTEAVVTLAERCKFYGQLGFKLKMPFVLETTAYDLCTLLERAHEMNAESHDALLGVFLELDRAAGSATQEASLSGVRKAQIKLATYYLANDAEDLARQIHDDMRNEDRDRLRAICAELEGTVNPDFWEVSDRGINFDYLPPDRRRRLKDFFAWFEGWQSC